MVTLTVVGRSSHALILNGVSDGIVVPQATFAGSGLELPEANSSIPTTGTPAHGIKTRGHKRFTTLTIEAWVRPDCGGVVISKDNVFELKVGQVGEPGPVVFTAHLNHGEGVRKVRLSTASEDTTTPRWSGTTFPRHGLDLHGSFNSHSGANDATSLNLGHRELLHIVASHRGDRISLFINGSLAVQEKLTGGGYKLDLSAGDLHIGGKGGQFRGAIEAIHLSSTFDAQMLTAHSPVPGGRTLGLWRFEEPADVHQTVYQSGTFSGGASVKTITIAAADAQAIIAAATGNAYDSTTPALDLTLSPYSNGNYKVVDYVSTPGTGATILVPHTPYNIMFNADAVNPLTKKPNQKPPERIRLLGVNGSTGVLTVESIHLDFNAAGGPRRGALHDRTADVDDHFVLLSGDLLLDSGTGKPYQPPHYASQAIDRTGQMVIDEGDHSIHGLIYSTTMATDTAVNPFAAVWPAALDTGFQIGHTGRHVLSVAEGHHYLRQFPKAHEEITHQSIDGTADITEVHYDASLKRLKDVAPVNCRVDVYREVLGSKVLQVRNEGWAFQMVENGMSALDATQRRMLAIGGTGSKNATHLSEFDYEPFLLKGPVQKGVSTDDTAFRRHHLRPVENSRVAILSVPTLGTTHNLAPFVEVHYNAVDITGASMGLSNPCLLVEKTVPSGEVILPTGPTRVLDVIIADLADATKDTRLYAPGGIMRLDTVDSTGGLPDTKLEVLFEAEAHEGLDHEDLLDESLTPPNYTPLHSTDVPNATPKVVSAEHAASTEHDAVFNRVVMDYTNPDLINQLASDDDFSTRAPSIVNTGAGVYDVGNTSESTHIFETFDIIDAQVGSGSKLTPIELLIHPSNRERTTQLTKVASSMTRPDETNTVSLQFLLSRARSTSFSDVEGQQRQFTLTCTGLMGDVAARGVDFLGSGAPDSHIVKEVMPGAPVVSVTLGGPGQGAVNTKPTFDPSPFSRLGGNTRRDCATQISVVGAPASPNSTITVLPLNNEATDLASWGTYCFPKQGRVYLENGASAEYISKTGSTFVFQSAPTAGLQKFLNADGSEAVSYTAWVATNSIVAGALLLVDDKFGEDSVCNDGTTVNDRMFQRMDTVSHDYQLGTQYASTRSLVEIPLFPHLFFEDRARCITPGPDNSLKLHVDCTYTAHTWAPNPVGRRCPDTPPTDQTVHSAYSTLKAQEILRKGTHVTRPLTNNSGTLEIYVEEPKMFHPESAPGAVTYGGANKGVRYFRAFLQNGEWVLFSHVDIALKKLVIPAKLAPLAFSEHFKDTLEVGMSISPGPGLFDESLSPIRDHPNIASSAYERRRSYYYDRANVQTQGGNIDYGLRQYVSAVELKAGPRENPHSPRTKTKRPRSKVISWTLGTNTLILEDTSLFPLGGATQQFLIGGNPQFLFRICYIDSAGNEQCAHYTTLNANTIVVSDKDAAWSPSAGDVIFVRDFHNKTASKYPEFQEDISLSRGWLHPYAGGGLRDGDTVWMNMHYTNPHAVEGLFCKSRGTFNEAKVCRHFNHGEGALASRPRDSIPLENFLIGDDCLETARNLVQHINKTVELNWAELGRDDTAPVVAFVDPYQATERFARVLLYDTAHDREFIAMQDIHMQVQSSADTPRLGSSAAFVDPTPGDAPFTGAPTTTNHSTELDVAAGFDSEVKSHAPAAASEFMEAAYAHNSFWNFHGQSGASLSIGNAALGHGHYTQDKSCLDDGSFPRLNESACCPEKALLKHREMQLPASLVDEYSTFFDTPEGTRAIPAFLCLKGIRNTALDLTTHKESRLKHLEHWTEMDFVRRLTLDLGEVGVKEGVTDIEAAAREVVRLVNQGGALNGRTHERRPADQYPGESERFDLSTIGPNPDAAHSDLDSSSPHLSADFSATGSTHDPAPFWDEEKAFSSHDRGSHMGYVRAHIGRVVEDAEGNEGFTVVIHSTVPGASGRNFCVWMDNSRGQTAYRPEFLIGHGGRFRNFWCRPDEVLMENMHPAPMPINKDGRPFAPVTTLNEYLPPEEPEDEFLNNLNYGLVSSAGAVDNANEEAVSGRYKNTVFDDSFESQSPDSVLIEGLRMGTRAMGRVNFGGMVAAGIPGFSPRAGKWAMGKEGNNRFLHAYGSKTTSPVLTEVEYTKTDTGHVPTAEVDDEAIGDNQLYGLRLSDHIGRTHTIRLIYSEFEEAFVNDKSTLPPTIDNEICIWFDDRDCGQGGFTIGKHMWGSGEVCGRLTGGTAVSWVGNTWEPYPAPQIGIHVATTPYASNVLTVTLTAPYTTGSALTHPDLLGYLGFADSGVFQFSVVSGNEGSTFSYTGRSHNAASGTHKFYGVEGGTTLFGGGVAGIISPRINWTTLLTDEVLAAAVNFAINMEDPNSERPKSTAFDCRNLRAADGRTLGEWGVAENAIRVRAHSRNHEALPLRCLFETTLEKDWGISASNVDDEISAADIQLGKRIPTGYLPRTVLHINTRYRGTNANTATPVLVDTMNNVVNTDQWRDNLRGDRYISKAGDLILPMIENETVEIRQSTIAVGTSPERTMDVIAALELWNVLIPASNNASSWGEKKQLWLDDQDWGVVETEQSANSEITLTWPATDDAAISSDWESRLGALSADTVLSAYALPAEVQEFDGYRLKGNEFGEPLVYFRGARDSPDHSVPLYFGGGFSGVVLDINDGTANDYSDFYTHPYATGPTGSAGLQNIGEKSTSYCLLDCAAMLAMFPGTPFLDDHKGGNNSPHFNQDSILSQDTDAGNNASAGATGHTYAGGGKTVNCTRPSPIVLRFGHQHARYSPSGDGGGKTTYIIFGPGQAFPTNTRSTEPQPSVVVGTGNLWSAVVSTAFMPNQISHGDGVSRNGFNAHLPPGEAFQRGNLAGWNYQTNWEPAHGSPNVISQDTGGGGTVFGYDQTATDGLYYGSHHKAGVAEPPPYSHPFDYAPLLSAGFDAIRTAGYLWHMDGGYHPGGHFLDNHILANPQHPSDNLTIPEAVAGKLHPASYRVSALLASAYGASTQHTAEEYVIVDATRVQNAEELGAVISCAINEWPGRDPLKALGGSFLPTFQSASKQDRYGWVEFDGISPNPYNETTGELLVYNPTGGSTTVPPIPPYGWLRTDIGGNPPLPTSYNRAEYGAGATPTFAPYKRVESAAPGVLRFILDLNYGGVGIGSLAAVLAEAMVDPPVAAIEALVNAAPIKVYVWSKSSCQVFNNGRVTGYPIAVPTSQDHMCRVHFNGITDAIDRTRPVGAIGWHGERYSYFNSLVLENPDAAGTNVFAAGLGAWHPFLGFSPYGTISSCQGKSIPARGESGTVVFNDDCPEGLSPRHLVAVTYESEMALAAKADRDATVAAGDWLYAKQKHGGHAATQSFGGTITVADQVYNLDRYVAPANGGPNVEAMFVTGQTQPVQATYNAAGAASSWWHSRVTAATHTTLSTPCAAPTGDLFWDDASVKANQMHADRNSLSVNCVKEDVVATVAITVPGTSYTGGIGVATTGGTGIGLTVTTTHGGGGVITGAVVYAGGIGYKVGDVVTVAGGGGDAKLTVLTVTAGASIEDSSPWDYWKLRSPGRNFSVEHVVWKRMDGGNLTMPASNVRGLGAVPRLTRVNTSNQAVQMGETIYGNCRFSFETTNAAMFPIIQAQELAHPQLAEQHPKELRNILMIPNEEWQFESIFVTDDTGQEHLLEGGSPFGTVVRDFEHISDRTSEGLSPSLANSGLAPNMRIRLPDADSIPGNIVVRSGFDRVQSYQNETFGSGGMMHPAQPAQGLKDTFTDTTAIGPRAWPTWENKGWEHISQDAEDLSVIKGKTRLAFPDQHNLGWTDHTSDNPLETSYEQHDRTLFFHVTRMGHTGTSRKPNVWVSTLIEDPLTFVSSAAAVVTAGSGPNANVWKNAGEQTSDGRWFARVEDSTGAGAIFSYTNTAGSTFTGVVFDPDFADFISGKSGLIIRPSWYVPAGSNRFFAARRLRDHSEMSGNSPDMKRWDWSTAANPVTMITAPKMTSMPIPRMGHHYVTPTMMMMPGHFSHPFYERVFNRHYGCRSSAHDPLDDTGTTSTTPGQNPLVWFSTPTGALRPSDVHGGAFTLLTETKVAYDGYGIAASKGVAGTENAAGRHILYLEAAGAYSLKPHFPDPMEVGAYQIVIQPNLHKQQLGGFHRNGPATAIPDASAIELTGQQVNLVIGISHDPGGGSATGTVALLLAEATMADTRGCEVFINEVMLDFEPDPGSQFANIPSLGLYNPMGVNENTSPPFTRRSLPYRPGTFDRSTPGYTISVPWWAILHQTNPGNAAAAGFRHLEWHKPDDYYQFCRATYGAVGCQITLAGYPSIYLDTYELHNRSRSLNPHCVALGVTQTGTVTGVVITAGGSGYSAGTAATTGGTGSSCQVTYTVDGAGALDTVTGIAAAGTGYKIGDVLTVTGGTAGTVAVTALGAGVITVDNNELFPVEPYYGEVLEYTDKAGQRQTANYTHRTGTIAHTLTAGPTLFEGVTTITPDFWNNLAVTVPQTILRASRAYDTFATGSVFKESKTSAITRVLPQTLHGSRDTNSLHMADSFLCLWHPNLGRPYTFYSDDIATTAATATITITAFTELNTGDKVNLIATDGTNYDFSQGVQSSVNGTFEATTSNDVTATNLMNVINTSSGPSGTRFTATVAGAVVTVAQAVGGIVGNTTVTLTDSGTAGMTKTNFIGGAGIRQFYDGVGTADNPVDEKALNHIPEHFETVHYNDFLYSISKGPFSFDMKAMDVANDGSVLNADGFGGGRAAQGDATRQYAGFWPGGSRGGPGASRLDGYGYIKAGWGDNDFGMSCTPFAIDPLTAGGLITLPDHTSLPSPSTSEHTRQFCFGYRFAVRPPFNRPRWSPAIRGVVEALVAPTAEQLMSGYFHGPFVAQDDRAQGAGGWKENANALLSTADVAWSATAAGILERQTQASAMLGNDQVMRQVRYSEGRRMTRSFGCPVRTLRNITSIRKKFPGDDVGLGKDELADAHRFYLVDWWGNTRGEDVRRFPARGFGIRPAWDPEEAYLDGGYANQPGTGGRDLWHLDASVYPSEQEGTNNTANSNTMTRVDWFNPQRSVRVGDRGDGRGCRWPTAFNESLLHDISTPMAATGMVVSHSTAEPAFSPGYMRPSNAVQSNTELPRGISARLGVAQDGLLKPEANVSENIELISGTFTPGGETLADPISRSAPRIGLDADTVKELSGGQEVDHITFSTQAHSLHTDSEVGQRLSLRGALDAGRRTLGHFDLTSPSWAANPTKAVVRVSNAHAMWALGGSYVLEARNYVKPFDDSNWGASGSSSSNPYSNAAHDPTASSGTQTNLRDKKIRFLLRPSRVLDNRHIEVFRADSVADSGTPQAGNDAYRATAGGKYGLFNYDMPNARVGTVNPTSPPYAPSYTVNSASPGVATSSGPLIPGADVTGFTGALDQTVGRILITENTLQHFRSDAPRRRAVREDDTEYTRPDFNVQPRHSQTLHPKGEAGTTSFNTGDHSTE